MITYSAIGTSNQGSFVVLGLKVIQGPIDSHIGRGFVERSWRSPALSFQPREVWTTRAPASIIQAVEVAIVASLVLGSIVLFISEALRADTVALLVMAVVLATGLCTPEQGLAGFSNEATITVAAMFVLSAGLEQTGLLSPLGNWIARSIKQRGVFLPLLLLSLVVGFVSAFINNTAAVAIFLPAIMAATREAEVSPGRFLLSLSFVSMAGGTITLIGTSTNLLVSSIAAEHGLEPFGMFEFAPLGLVLVAACIGYMMTVGYKLLPDRRPPAELTQDFEMGPHLSTLKLAPESSSEQTVKEGDLHTIKGDLLRFTRREQDRLAEPDNVLEPEDSITYRVENPEELDSESKRLGLEVSSQPVGDRDLEGSRGVLVEAGVSSNMEGSTLDQGDVRQSFDAVPLAVRHDGVYQHRGLDDLKLKGGDTILFRVERDRLNQLRLSRNFYVLSQQESQYNTKKRPLALALVALAVLVAALKWSPIVVTASVAAILMIVTGCLTTEEAYRAIDWKVIFLLAGMLSLGQAMESSGAARQLAELLLAYVREMGPHVALGLFYLVTTLLTATMSNNATAVLLAPVAISIAESMQVSPRPFLVAVAFAASACFSSPVGYQTNVMIYGPGRFKFRDFVTIGGPLNLLFLVISVLVIPMIWSF